MNVEDYKNWLEAPIEKNYEDGVTVIITTITPDPTINMLKILLNIHCMRIEILVYDDSEESGELPEFCKKHDIFYYKIKQEERTYNAHFGRSNGIKKASMPFITFIDGDDELTQDVEICYAKCLELFKKRPDIKVATYMYHGVHENKRADYYGDKIKKQQLAGDSFIENNVSNYTIGINDLKHEEVHTFCHVWDKLYRADVLKSLKIYNSCREDSILNIQVCLVKSRIGFVNKIGYVHFFGNDQHLARCQYSKDNVVRFNNNLKYFEEFLNDYKDQMLNCKSKTIQKFWENGWRDLQDLKKI